MKRGLLPLNALRALESTLRLGQMRRAAEELGVTYGAISRQIRRLENLIEVDLFEGPRNRLEPTAAARRLQPALSSAFDTLEAAVNRERGAERRTLDVTSLGMLAMRWLIPLLPDFRRLHPDIDVRLLTTETPDVSAPPSGVSITVVSGPSRQDAVIYPLFAERLGPVLHASLFQGGEIEPADLSGLPYLHTKASPQVWSEWCRAHGTDATGRSLEFDTLPPLVEGILTGLGVAMVPEIAVEPDVRAKRLVAPFGFSPSGRMCVAVTQSTPNDDADTFVRWLREKAEIRA